MATMLMVLALCVASEEATSVESPGDSSAAASQATEPRRFHELEADLRALIRAEARATSQTERATAIRRMTVLYREIVRDPRLLTSDTLKSYKAKLWSRLTHIENELKRKIAREQRLSGKRVNPATLELANYATDSLATQLALLGHTMGGPAQFFSQTASAESAGAYGGGTAPDHGQALVDLIERTIAPNFWDVNGGPGTIVYYAPLHAIVVRATSEVHGNVAGILGGLRRAGQ